MSSKEQVLLFDLFEEIRKDKLFGNPGLEEYYLIFELARQNYTITNFDELKFVLEAIWLKNHAQRGRFRGLLERRRGLILEFIKSIDQVKEKGQEDAVKKNPTAQETPRIKPQNNEPIQSTNIDEKNKRPSGNEGNVEKTQVEAEETNKTSFSIGVGSQQSRYLYVGKQNEPTRNILETPYLFTDDYFPIKRRHLQQAWRSLKNKFDIGETDELDIPKTIRHTANRGYFSDLIFHRNTINELELFIFLDKSESMISEIEFGKELCESASLSNVHKNVGPWYFYEVPKLAANGDYILNNEDYTNTVQIKKLLTTKGERNKFILKKNVVVLIYSDCGTLARNIDEERVHETAKFINYLYQITAYIAWLNPAPRTRWPWTNSERIARMIPMFEATRNDTENAVAALKGRSHT